MNEMTTANEKLPRSVLRRFAALVLALCMMIALLPAVTFDARADFSDAAIDKLLNWGVIGGYPDGALHPERSLTRAEFVAMVNRAYGYTELGNTPFIDVPANAWFSDDINIAYNAKYFNGVSPRMAGPDTELTREQAMVLLARNMRLEPMEGEVTEFSDGRSFSDWSRAYARAAQEAGIIGGYADGSFKPQKNISRGEMAVMLQRSLGTLINKPGTHTLSDVYGNVTVSSPNTVLKDSTIAGDLYVTGGLSLGDVTLQNVRVLGKIVVAGGGESQSGESVILRNVQADSLVVDSIAKQYVSIATEGDTSIGEAILRSDSYVQDRTRPGDGLLNITLDSVNPNAAFTLSGNLETVVNRTPDSTLNIAMGTVDTLTIDEEAKNSVLNLDVNSTASKLNLDTAATVSGVGDIAKLSVNAPGSTVSMLPDGITIRPGLTAEIAGQTMNAQQAQESSSDPRLLAGYPKVKNVAPKEGTGVYSANKGGTVYWAVSPSINGSVNEEELISPTKDNKRVTVTGNTPIEKAETEYTSKFDKLTPDTNYYLSTVLVDARGRHSPVKVASFITPDDTVPAFASGYPNVMKNYCEPLTKIVKIEGKDTVVVQRDQDGFPKCNYRVQVASMPNKTCQLYYAVYPKGSTAPTAEQFRSGAIGTPIRSGVEDATKNRINFIELSGLEELTEYDIYLCYVDTDGSNSSPVQKLSFKTVDGKPPRFQFETPVVTNEALNALTLSANVNEDARVFWVASKDVNYIKNDTTWSETEWWERACRQIESGTNSVRSGVANARANADTAINITGLQPATRYYIYFVAKDNAGNYSEFFRVAYEDKDHPEQSTKVNEQPYKYSIKASTLDNIPPECTQEFTKTDASDKTKPYADTDIRLVFSEAVMQYSTHRDKAPDFFKDFYTLYTEYLKTKAAAEAAPTDADAAAAYALAQKAYFDTLRQTIKLYSNAAVGTDSVVERTEGNEGSDKWVIDYRKATVETDVDKGTMTVVFHTDPDTTKSALNLASGATYHFVLDDICDTSTSKNRMGRYQMPDFTTISAQVQLLPIEVTNVNYKNTATSSSGVIENIPIDMAFSMTPISTSVEKNVNWDILFWSDTSCEFEVYELDTDNNGTSGVAIRPLENGQFSKQTDGHYSVSQTVENVEPPDPDTSADNYLGYVGQSYFNKFYDVKDTFPSVTGKGNVLTAYATNPDVYARGIMERNVPKYYGIHITKVGNVAESEGRGKTWDASVSFRISVVTGKSDALGDLSTEIRDSTIRDFEQKRGVSLIHSPKPFTLYKRFANQDAPEFATRYPGFTAQDVSVDMEVMLDRPGTLYYAIVPASTWHTNPDNSTYVTYSPYVTTKNVNNTPNGAELKYYQTQPDTESHRYYAQLIDDDSLRAYVPLNGSDTIVPAYNATSRTFDTSKLTPKMELVTPSSQAIYSQSLSSTTGVKVGRVSLGSGKEVINVDGLEPETVYLAMFSMQGTGQVYSKRAQVFQFTTQKITRPRLVVYNQTDHADITTKNMDAEVDAALFLLDSLVHNATLNRNFTEVIDSKVSSEWARDYAGKVDTNGKKYDDYKVWEAITKSYGDGNQGGSLFDYFADEETKIAVAKLIRSDGGSALVRVAGKSGTLKLGADPTTFSFLNNMESLPTQYILLAVAHAAGKQGQSATGHSLGFGGASPLYKGSAEKPIIKTISSIGGITADFVAGAGTSDGFVLKGDLRLTFSIPLYIFFGTDSVSGLTRREAITGTTVGSYFIDPDTTAQLGGRFTAQGSSDPTTVLSAVTVKLKDSGIENDQSFLVNANLCGQFGSPRQGVPLQIVLHYDKDTNMVTVKAGRFEKKTDPEFAYAKEWYPTEGQVTFRALNPIKPAPTDFQSLTPTSITLDAGKSQTVTATLKPGNAAGSISYAWDDTYQDGTVGNITPLASGLGFTVTGGSFLTQKQGKIIVTLCDSSGNPVLDSGSNPITRSVLVTVRSTTIGSVEVSPTDVSLKVRDAAGAAGPVTVTVKDVENKNLGTSSYSADAYYSTGNLKIKLSTPEKLLDGSYRFTISLDSGYYSKIQSGAITPTSETIYIYFNAAEPGVSPGQLNVFLDASN